MNQIRAGAVLNYVIIGLNMLLGIGYTPFMLRMLGQNEYGLYALVSSIIAYLTLLDLGMGTAVVRYTARFRAEGHGDRTGALFGMFLLLYCAIGVVAFLIGLGLYTHVDALFDRTMSPGELQQARTMILLLLVNLAVTFPMSIFNSIITACEEFVFQKLLAIARIVLSTATVVVLLLAGYRAVAMVVVQTLFNVAVLLLNFLFCRRRLQIRISFGRVRRAFVREVLLFSVWAFVGDAVYHLYYNAGQFVLGAVSGTAAIAVYALAVTLMQMYMLFSSGLSGVLLPRVTAMAAHGEPEQQLSDLFIRVGRLQYAVLICLLSGFVLFGRAFVTLWAGPGYEEVYAVALLFFFPCLVPLIQNTGITILQARNQLRYRSLMLLGVALASLFFQVVLARRYGAVGCAAAVGAATFIGQGVLLNRYYRRVQRLDIPRFWREIGAMSRIPLLLTVAGWILLRRVELDTLPRLAAAIAAYLALYVPLFWCFGLRESERVLLLQPLRRAGRKWLLKG